MQVSHLQALVEWFLAADESGHAIVLDLMTVSTHESGRSIKRTKGLLYHRGSILDTQYGVVWL